MTKGSPSLLFGPQTELAIIIILQFSLYDGKERSYRLNNTNCSSSIHFRFWIQTLCVHAWMLIHQCYFVIDVFVVPSSTTLNTLLTQIISHLFHQSNKIFWPQKYFIGSFFHFHVSLNYQNYSKGQAVMVLSRVHNTVLWWRYTALQRVHNTVLW